MSNYRLCAFPPPFPPSFPPASFLKSVKYFKCTERYREEYNAPPDPVIISLYFLQFCFLKEIEDIRSSGCPPFCPLPPPPWSCGGPFPSVSMAFVPTYMSLNDKWECPVCTFLFTACIGV